MDSGWIKNRGWGRENAGALYRGRIQCSSNFQRLSAYCHGHLSMPTINASTNVLHLYESASKSQVSPVKPGFSAKVPYSRFASIKYVVYATDSWHRLSNVLQYWPAMAGDMPLLILLVRHLVYACMQSTALTASPSSITGRGLTAMPPALTCE